MDRWISLKFWILLRLIKSWRKKLVSQIQFFVSSITSFKEGVLLGTFLKSDGKNLPGSFNNSMVKTARNLVGHQIGWWLWWQLWWRIWWFTNFVDKFDDLFWSQNLSPNLSLNSSQYSSPNISPNFANQQIFHQIFHQNHHPISWPTKCGDENDIKIITQFGESPNKVTNMSPNSSPNLVITKFVTKFITKFVTKYLGDLYVGMVILALSILWRRWMISVWTSCGESKAGFVLINKFHIGICQFCHLATSTY